MLWTEQEHLEEKTQEYVNVEVSAKGFGCHQKCVGDLFQMEETVNKLPHRNIHQTQVRQNRQPEYHLSAQGTLRGNKVKLFLT